MVGHGDFRVPLTVPTRIEPLQTPGLHTSAGLRTMVCFPPVVTLSLPEHRMPWEKSLRRREDSLGESLPPRKRYVQRPYSHL